VVHFLKGEGSTTTDYIARYYIVYPEDKWVWIFGDGLQAFLGGVISDCGYIQLLWGLGLFGLAAVCGFQLWMVARSWRMYWGKNLDLAATVIVIAIMFWVANYKGQYFVGQRSADLLVLFYGIMLGSVVQKTSTEGIHTYKRKCL